MISFSIGLARRIAIELDRAHCHSCFEFRHAQRKRHELRSKPTWAGHDSQRENAD
jgi:hypothetical protein